MKKSNINIETFDLWAREDRDLGMQKGHTPAVERMLEIIRNHTESTNKKFSFLDIGCGNGWVVRMLSKDSNCIHSVGIDGSPSMVKKAISNNNDGEYICADIENWIYKSKFKIAFSMETFYYFSNPALIVKNVYNNLLEDNGIFILGIDHYKENKSTLNWDDQFNIKTTTMRIEEWRNIFLDVGFSNVYAEQFNAKENWAGTLILLGIKKNVF
tara:strand:- start:63 stop:701 length:639 start_codon:yes stop_codon:yes gene_type:complete